MTPNFLADYGSGFIAVIGDPCSANNFRVGDFENTEVTTTYNVVAASELSVYPNPSTGAIS